MISKRTALGALGVGSLAGATVLHQTRHRNPYAPVLDQVDVPVVSPISALDRLKIGFFTDTHMGPVVRPADVDRALALLYAESPDLILLGGDYICESPRYAAEAAAVLADVASTAELGAYAVLGNHDYSCDAVRVASALEKRGIQILRNEAAQVPSVAGSIWIVGIDDAILGSPDLATAFDGVPAESDVLALWHEPDWAASTARHGALLQLSGHSHGGQVRLPILGGLAAPSGGRRFVSGLNDAGGMPVYTSRGIGVYRPPVRFRCPPEVTLVRLKPEPSG